MIDGTVLQQKIQTCRQDLTVCRAILVEIEHERTEVSNHVKETPKEAVCFGRGQAFQKLQSYESVCAASLMMLQSVIMRHVTELQGVEEMITLKKAAMERTYAQQLVEGGVC